MYREWVLILLMPYAYSGDLIVLAYVEVLLEVLIMRAKQNEK